MMRGPEGRSMSQGPTRAEDAEGVHRRWFLPLMVLLVPLLLLADFGRVQLRLHQMVADVTWGDTEAQVEQKLGEPDSRGRWGGSSGHGARLVYRCPYVWEYALSYGRE